MEKSELISHVLKPGKLKKVMVWGSGGAGGGTLADLTSKIMKAHSATHGWYIGEYTRRCTPGDYYVMTDDVNTIILCLGQFNMNYLAYYIELFTSNIWRIKWKKIL